jgi:hypothetical protein
MPSYRSIIDPQQTVFDSGNARPVFVNLRIYDGFLHQGAHVTTVVNLASQICCLRIGNIGSKSLRTGWPIDHEIFLLFFWFGLYGMRSL